MKNLTIIILYHILFRTIILKNNNNNNNNHIHNNEQHIISTTNKKEQLNANDNNDHNDLTDHSEIDDGDHDEAKKCAMELDKYISPKSKQLSNGLTQYQYRHQHLLNHILIIRLDLFLCNTKKQKSHTKTRLKQCITK